MANMVRKKKKSVPVQLFRVGIVVDVCCTGFHLLPETARALGFKHGNYLQVDHAERGTCVVRELVSCNRGCHGMRKDYLYMDEESARYLNAALHDEVSLKLADYEMDVP